MNDASERSEDRTTGRRAEEVDVVPLHTPPSWWTWILLLTGPVTWAVHFLVVYLAVEAWCSSATAANGGSLPTWLGASAPVSVTLAATAVAAAIIVVDLVFTARRYRQGTRLARLEPEDATDTDDQLVRDRHLLLVGCLLSPLSLVAVLFVGLSALWVPTC